MPKGLFFSLLGFGMYTLFTGSGSNVLALSNSWRLLMYPSGSPRKFDLVIPSIPAVPLPLFCRTVWAATRSHTS